MADELFNALSHFGGSLVGEGDGEDGVRSNAALVDEIGDAVSDDTRLARARSGEYQHRPVDGHDSFTLLGIKFVE
jgi:hypothetical protein